MAIVARLVSTFTFAASVAAVAAAVIHPAAAGPMAVWRIDIAADTCGLAVTVHNDDYGNAIIPRVFYTVAGLGSGQLTWAGSESAGKRMYDDHYWLPGPLPAGANGTVTAYDPYKPSASESDFPGLQVATVDFVVSDGGDCIRQLGSLRGTAFEDIDANGKWDAGEPKMGLAWYKVTDGGGWYVCGWIGSGGTYGVPVTAGRYDVLPVTLNGYRTTTPRIRAKVEAGQASLGNDIGFVKDPVARQEACDAYNPPRPGKPRIIETANRAGTFTILMTALKKAGLVEMLDGEGPWTLFAPTDAAFARLPAGAVEALLGDPAALKSFALRHAIAGDWRAVDLSRQASIRMLDGEPASIEMADGAVLIEGSAISTPDILTGNGVLHVIDRVLLPPAR